uniref:Dehydrogenase/reductase SDR family member 7B n=2 Tax=Macrostomum lignano TaxID=282301 RepID=A0A1I8IMB7_9PLAT
KPLTFRTPLEAMNLLAKAVLGLPLCLLAFGLARSLLFDLVAGRWHQASRENSAGKRVLVTGSSRGIGEALAHVYAEVGAHVTVHARSLNSLQEVVAECRRRGAASVHPIAADLSKPGEAARLVAAAAAAMGGLDIAVVNHISPSEFATVARAAPDSAQGQRAAMQTNYFSYAEAARAALPHLEKSAGSLVLISSAAARLPIPYCYEYCASKRALGGFFSALRQELALNGSAVHAGLALIGSIGTESARRVLPKYYKVSIPLASPADTATDIAAIPVGRLRELASPWTIRPVVLLAEFAPEFVEQQLQSLSRHF